MRFRQEILRFRLKFRSDEELGGEVGSTRRSLLIFSEEFDFQGPGVQNRPKLEIRKISDFGFSSKITPNLGLNLYSNSNITIPITFIAVIIVR